jgi:hypothetical protein
MGIGIQYMYIVYDIQWKVNVENRQILQVFFGYMDEQILPSDGKVYFRTKNRTDPPFGIHPVFN